MKDRVARAVLASARADGRLAPGGVVVEMTSGNMGAGLAVVCAALGHPLVVSISAGNSPQRARMLEALGAEVVLVPQVDGTPGRVTGADLAAAVAAAEDITAARSGFYVDQFNAPEAPRAHEETGREIWQQAAGRADGFVTCVGTGATFVGIARALRSRNPATVCAAVEPEGCEPLAGKRVTKPQHLLQGTGYGSVPPLWQPELMDLSIAVSDAEAEAWRKRLAREEGLHVGFSAAANVCAAVRLLTSGRLSRDAVVATILCDTGLKY
jgi:cysteine synthase A